MAIQLPTLQEIAEAQKLVYQLMLPTPQISWPLLNQKLEARVWIKHENHTPIGAFKARSAVFYAAQLFRSGNSIKGIITATRGNHGQSVALGGQRFNVPVTIVVPHSNSVEKNAAMRSQGARLIEFGQDFQESREHAQKLSREQGLHFIPPFHHDIVTGVATYWMELFTAVSDLDAVYAPIGMGSGICAACAVRNGMKLKTKIIGVAAEGAPAYAFSFEAGRRIEAPVTTVIADGMACRVPDDDALEIIQKNVDHIVTVSDDEIRRAMRIYFSDTHNVIEGAGAASLAAALKEKSSVAGKRIALVATGGNVDRDVFTKVLLERDIEQQSQMVVAS
ncbi:MAG: threonine dehydratase [Terriglobales bacterium]